MTTSSANEADELGQLVVTSDETDSHAVRTMFAKL